jgi:hypothetical protein
MFLNLTQLIEHCGYIEMEIEKILKHSSKLYTFISHNLYLFDVMNECSERVEKMKNSKDAIKKLYLTNSAKSIQLGNKKKNIEKNITLLKHLKSLKEISDVLKLLSNNSSKLLISYGLIEKGKSILKLYKNKNIKVLKLFEEEYVGYTNKILDKLIIEFNKDLKEGISSLVQFNENGADSEAATYVSIT